MKVITGIAPVNIAVIKYWGKRDEDLILPVNDSISVTLDTEHMCARTTIMASPDFDEYKFTLNRKESDLNNPRFKKCLEEVKKRASLNCKNFLDWKLQIFSDNNFPTAAGLASSAAGYACLVNTLSALYQVDGDISGIARLGSGSACRSVFGGFVHWRKGVLESGEDSVAVQIAPASHWPELRIIILVVSESQKTYSSTNGMKRSVETSELLKFRAEQIVPKRIEKMIRAIENRDFSSFAQITMQDSNQFHAICLDTYPPCFYMNDVSKFIVELVHSYNEYCRTTKVAYTFDAGSNACLYLLEKDVEEFVSLINEVFPYSIEASDYYRGIPVELKSTNLIDNLSLKKQIPDLLKYVIHTKVGEGPKIIKEELDNLLSENGYSRI